MASFHPWVHQLRRGTSTGCGTGWGADSQALLGQKEMWLPLVGVSGGGSRNNPSCCFFTIAHNTVPLAPPDLSLGRLRRELSWVSFPIGHRVLSLNSLKKLCYQRHLPRPESVGFCLVHRGAGKSLIKRYAAKSTSNFILTSFPYPALLSHSRVSWFLYTTQPLGLTPFTCNAPAPPALLALRSTALKSFRAQRIES